MESIRRPGRGVTSFTTATRSAPTLAPTQWNGPYRPANMMSCLVTRLPFQLRPFIFPSCFNMEPGTPGHVIVLNFFNLH